MRLCDSERVCDRAARAGWHLDEAAVRVVEMAAATPGFERGVEEDRAASLLLAPLITKDHVCAGRGVTSGVQNRGFGLVVSDLRGDLDAN